MFCSSFQLRCIHCYSNWSKSFSPKMATFSDKVLFATHRFVHWLCNAIMCITFTSTFHFSYSFFFYSLCLLFPFSRYMYWECAVRQGLVMFHQSVVYQITLVIEKLCIWPYKKLFTQQQIKSIQSPPATNNLDRFHTDTFWYFSAFALQKSVAMIVATHCMGWSCRKDATREVINFQKVMAH